MKTSDKNPLLSFMGAALAVAWYLLFPLIAGIAAVIVFLALSPGIPPGTMSVDAQFVKLTFTGAPTGDYRLALMGTLGVLLAWLAVTQFVVYHLRRLIAGIRDGRPFDARNSRHIRAIGVAAICGSAAHALVCLAVGWLMMITLHIPGVEISPRMNLPITGIFMGLVILVLARVFRRGAELQEDADLTV